MAGFNREVLMAIKDCTMLKTSDEQLVVFDALITSIRSDSEGKSAKIKSIVDVYLIDNICELIGTNNHALTLKIIELISLFTNSRHFFEKSGEMVILQILRVVEYNKNEELGLLMIQLLLDLTKGLRLTRLRATRCKPARFIFALTALAKKSDLNVKLRTYQIVNELFLAFKSGDTFMTQEEDVIAIIGYLEFILSDKFKKTPYEMSALCQIGIGFLACRDAMNEILRSSSNQILLLLVQFMQSQAVDFVLELEHLQSHWVVHNSFLMCLRKLYKIRHEFPKITNLTKVLLNKNVLSLIIFRIQNETKNLAKILGVLIEVLSAFAEIDLEAEDCVSDWIKLGINELASIPIQEWPVIKLAKGHYDEMCITLILFGYFLAKSETFPNCSFFRTTKLLEIVEKLEKSNNLPQLLLKPIWLNFSVAFTNNFKMIRAFELRECVKLFSRMCNPSVAKIFMYHPAFLFWILQAPNLPDKIKYDTVVLWLKFDSEPNDFLKHFLAKTPGVSQIFVEIVQNESDIFKSAIVLCWQAIELQLRLTKPAKFSLAEDLVAAFTDNFDKFAQKGLKDKESKRRLKQIARLMYIIIASYRQYTPKMKIENNLSAFLENIVNVRLDLSPRFLKFYYVGLIATQTNRERGNYFIVKDLFNNLKSKNRRIFSIKILLKWIDNQLRLGYSDSNSITINWEYFLDIFFDPDENFVALVIHLLSRIVKANTLSTPSQIFLELHSTNVNFTLESCLSLLPMLAARESSNGNVERSVWECLGHIYQFLNQKYAKIDLNQHFALHPPVRALCSQKLRHSFNTWQFKETKLMFIKHWTKSMRLFFQDNRNQLQIKSNHFQDDFNSDLIYLVNALTSRQSKETMTNELIQLLRDILDNIQEISYLLPQQIIHKIITFHSKYLIERH